MEGRNLPIRKKPSLAADNIGNYRPITNVSFLSKVVERVVVDQLQALLDETNALDPLQLGFRTHHGMETALVALFDDLLREDVTHPSSPVCSSTQLRFPFGHDI